MLESSHLYVKPWGGWEKGMLCPWRVHECWALCLSVYHQSGMIECLGRKDALVWSSCGPFWISVYSTVACNCKGLDSLTWVVTPTSTFLCSFRAFGGFNFWFCHRFLCRSLFKSHNLLLPLTPSSSYHHHSCFYLHNSLVRSRSVIPSFHTEVQRKCLLLKGFVRIAKSPHPK